MVIATPIDIDQIDLADPEVHIRAETHEIWRTLRREAPVHWNESKNAAPFWSVTKYEDVIHISRNPLLFSSEAGISIPPREVESTPAFNAIGKMLIIMDPPRHVRLRRLVI